MCRAGGGGLGRICEEGWLVLRERKNDELIIVARDGTEMFP